MKPGVRALGVAESFREDRSTLCGAVTRRDGVLDGIGFASCTVGGLDATEAVIDLWGRTGREDVQYLFLSGVALAWYNVVEFERLAGTIPVPVLAVTYERSDGLEKTITSHFPEEEAEVRLARYRSLPDRIPVVLDDETVFVRAAGIDEGDIGPLLEAFTRSGGRPEPLRVARLAARAADRWRRELPAGS